MVKSSLLLSKINRRKIVKNFGQFISIIIITLLAITLAVGLNSSAKTLEAKLDLLLDDTNFADGIVYGDINSDTHVFDILQYDYQKRLQLTADDNGNNIDLLISDGIARINKPYTADYDGGVYITHAYAQMFGYSVGDLITLEIDFSMFSGFLSNYYINILNNSVRTGKENILVADTIEIEFVIDGLMYHSEGIVDSNPISMTYDDFTTKLDELVIENYRDTWDYYPTSMSNSQIISYLENNLYGTCNSILFIGDYDYINNLYYFDTDDYFVFDTKYIPGVFQMNMDITQAYQLTYVFPVVFIIVSILIIITTISQLIFKERLNIATLKSIGISDGKIYSHYIFLTISLCLIGGVIGSILGPLFLPDVMGIKYDLTYNVPDVNNVFNLFAIVTNVLLFVIISTLVSYFILRSSVRMHPAVLIKHTGASKFKNSKIKIKSWNLKIALRNISKQSFRSLMVIVGVGGCAALFITGFGIDDTMDNTVYFDTEINFDTDATITFSNYSNDLASVISNLDNVSYYEEYVIKTSTIKDVEYNVTSIYFIDENTKIFNQGNFDGVYLSSKIANNLGISVGDEILFSIDGVDHNFVVTYIIDTGFTHGVFIPNDLEVEYIPTNAWIKTDNQEEIDTLISSYIGVSDVYTKEEFIITLDEILGPISIIKVTLQVFAFLLGVVVLFNLALLNFKEKSRDIATLKVLGLSNIEISKSLIYEMMILSILGGLFGLAVGYPLMELLLSINEVEVVTYIYNLRVESYLLTFVFTTFTALVINLILFKQIDKIKMVESLKSVE